MIFLISCFFVAANFLVSAAASAAGRSIKKVCYALFFSPTLLVQNSLCPPPGYWSYKVLHPPWWGRSNKCKDFTNPEKSVKICQLKLHNTRNDFRRVDKNFDHGFPFNQAITFWVSLGPTEHCPTRNAAKNVCFKLGITSLNKTAEKKRMISKYGD